MWEEIIPESYRAELEEEGRQKEMAELYLGPRQRKTVLAANDENKVNENRKQKKDNSDDSDNDEEDNSDDNEGVR